MATKDECRIRILISSSRIVSRKLKRMQYLDSRSLSYRESARLSARKSNPGSARDSGSEKLLFAPSPRTDIAMSEQSISGSLGKSNSIACDFELSSFYCLRFPNCFNSKEISMKSSQDLEGEAAPLPRVLQILS